MRTNGWAVRRLQLTVHSGSIIPHAEEQPPGGRETILRRQADCGCCCCRRRILHSSTCIRIGSLCHTVPAGLFSISSKLKTWTTVHQCVCVRVCVCENVNIAVNTYIKLLRVLKCSDFFSLLWFTFGEEFSLSKKRETQEDRRIVVLVYKYNLGYVLFCFCLKIFLDDGELKRRGNVGRNVTDNLLAGWMDLVRFPLPFDGLPEWISSGSWWSIRCGSFTSRRVMPIWTLWTCHVYLLYNTLLFLF